MNTVDPDTVDPDAVDPESVDSLPFKLRFILT